jgi:lipopolysaccharide export system protein LptA
MRPSTAVDSRHFRIALALLLCALAAGNALARKSDRGKPMDVTADHSDTSLADDSVSTLTGNVVVTQGTMVIHADKAVINRKGGDISRAVLTGAPVSLKQDDENGEPMTATSTKVDYDLATNIAVFTGNAIIDQPARGQMHGEKIVYNVDSGNVTSGGDGTRVSMHILPKARTDKPAPAINAAQPDQPPIKTP